MEALLNDAVLSYLCRNGVEIVNIQITRVTEHLSKISINLYWLKVWYNGEIL
jgi:hypothetical protein